MSAEVGALGNFVECQCVGKVWIKPVYQCWLSKGVSAVIGGIGKLWECWKCVGVCKG